MKTNKYKVLVILKEGVISKSIHPIIEAVSEHQARQIAKAQYPQGDVRTVQKIS